MNELKKIAPDHFKRKQIEGENPWIFISTERIIEGMFRTTEVMPAIDGCVVRTCTYCMSAGSVSTTSEAMVYVRGAWITENEDGSFRFGA